MTTLQLDGKPVTPEVAARQAWMRLLSRAPMELLEPALARFADSRPQWLRAPETGLVMARGRIGGSGARFNFGEVSVTRCALRVDAAVVNCKAVGIAYVLGRSHRRAELAATADALLQDPLCSELLPSDFLKRIDEWLENQRRERADKAQATRVEFFTVARETSGASTQEDE